MTTERIATLFCVCVLLCGVVHAQSVTSNVVGTVVDPAGASVPGADIQIKDRATGATRTATSSTEGIFRITNLPPGAYDLTVKANGFKTYAQSALNLASQETRDLGTLQLTVGALSEQVSVTAVATPIQTASSEKSALVDGNQLLSLAIKGRDMMAMLNTIPGIVNTNPGETTTEYGIYYLNINGPQGVGGAGRNNVTVDGIADMDTGGEWTTFYEPNMDSVAEVRVLTSNYQAEYGHLAGAQISVITKGGSREFHGSAWASKRHEMFNAKSWFNNFNNQQKPIYRYFIGGWSVGGPVYVPGRLNTQKTKLFFYASQEYTKQRPTSVINYAQVPTAAQRKGDFSGVIDNGTKKMLVMYDPTTRNQLNATQQANLGQFITSPASAAWGQAMLNYFPLPNECSWSNNAPGCWNETDIPAGQSQNFTRNYRYTFTGSHPRRNDVIRLDSNVTNRLTAWYRYVNDYDKNQTSPGIPLFSAAAATGCASLAPADRPAHTECWQPYSIYNPNPGHGHGLGLTYTISPTLVNEASFGYSWNTWDQYPSDPGQLDRSLMNTPPHWFDEKSGGFATETGSLPRPTLAPGNQNFAFWVPGVSGGSAGTNPGYTMPYTNWNYVYSITDNISWTKGAHSLKAGIFWERAEKIQQGGSGSYLGLYNFSGGPMDSGYGNGNMYLGNISSYSEGGRIVGDYWYTGVEAFVQDNWRIGKRLTLDLGVRFYHLGTRDNPNKNSAVWLASAYNASKAGRLYRNGCSIPTPATGQCPTANQIAVDPLTGATTYSTLVGTFVPGSGDYFSGNQVLGVSNLLPSTAYTQPTLQPAIRTGLAWDVFGNGKTALRAGWGQTFQRSDTAVTMTWGGIAPVTYNKAVYYTNVAAVPGLASTAGVSPIGSGGIVGHQPYEQTISTSIGIQQRVGFGTVVEAAYVGSFRRHILQTQQMNAIAMFSAYDPKNANPWSPTNPKRAWSSDFYRPLQGLSAVQTSSMSGSANYNSLQVSVRRAMSHGLSYGLALTQSKLMSCNSTMSPYWPDRFRDCGPSYSGAPTVVVFNYIYEVPRLGKRLNIRPLGWVTDNWMISGITQIYGRARIAYPGTAGFSGTTNTNAAPDFTGSAEGARPLVLRDPTVRGSDVKFDMSDWTKTNTFDWTAFVNPMPCSWTPMATPQAGIGQSPSCFGNAGAGSLLSMPINMNNWDVTFAKSFPLGSERRVLMFRAEMYNVFNHTQFTGYNTSITLDFPSWQNGIVKQTNTSLGRPTGVRDPRKMAMSLRFQF